MTGGGKMIVVMLSAPFKGLSHQELETQISKMRALAEFLWIKGVAVICPHLNTYGFVDEPRQNYLEGYKEIAKRCDVVLAIWGTDSEGVQMELGVAKYPFTAIDEFLWWLDECLKHENEE